MKLKEIFETCSAIMEKEGLRIEEDEGFDRFILEFNKKTFYIIPMLDVEYIANNTTNSPEEYEYDFILIKTGGIKKLGNEEKRNKCLFILNSCNDENTNVKFYLGDDEDVVYTESGFYIESGIEIGKYLVKSIKQIYDSIQSSKEKMKKLL